MDDESLNGIKNTVQEHQDGEIGEPESGQAAAANSAAGNQNHLANGNINGADSIGPNARPSERDKSDSEAETVVLSGKADDHDHKTTKAIKLEDADSGSDVELDGVSAKKVRVAARKHGDGGRRVPLKRKRGEERPNEDKDNEQRRSREPSFSSSSPAPRGHSSKSSETRSDRSRSSPPLDDDRNGKLRKRDDKKPSHKHRRSREVTSESVDAPDGSGRRNKFSLEERSQRSESPHPQTKSRARSTQFNTSATQRVNKRRKPAPINLDRRTRASEDVPIDSDDSSSVHSHHRTRRLPSGAMSPAKVSHKKNRDRNGRTLLARACMQGVDETRRWVKERPQDINEPDNAGNTPLQIASLAGMDEVVKLLLESGCDTSCRNIDHDTPLIDAVENGHLEVVKLLLRAGADPRQRNAKGQEPVELVDLDEEVGEQIKTALLQARKDSDGLRKPSEDHRQSLGLDVDTPSALGPGASPTENNRSPPPFDLAGRKRGARSQHTDDALLWVNPTPQRLRDEASKGNLKFVDHILKMRPEANTDAVLAAVKGGHFDILNLMIAMASPNPDPEPLYSSDHQKGFNTPMLAAIGRGNLDIVKLLSNQSGFNPTRRMFKGLTYVELAEERKGEGWEDEVEVLQNALEDFEHNGGRRSHTSSPKRVRTKRPAPKEELTEPLSSSQEVRRMRKSDPQVKEDPDAEAKRRPSWHGTAARQRGADQDHASSDRVPNRSSAHRSKAGDNREGEPYALIAQRTDSLKPKRKLMSGNELKTGQEGKRKSKAAEETLAEPVQGDKKPRHRQSFSNHTGQRSEIDDPGLDASQVKKASSEEPPRTTDDFSKKRMRVSVSPKVSKTDLNEVSKKKKRQRINSHGNAIEQDQGGRIPPAPIVDEIVSSPTSMQSPAHGTAPVAFMGASTSSASIDSVMDKTAHPSIEPTMNSTNSQMPLSPRPVPLENLNKSSAVDTTEIDRGQEQALDRQRAEAERLREQMAQKERQAALEQEDNKRRKRLKQEEESRSEAERQAHEAERQAQLEREAEEARVAKAKREEELQRRRLEEEKTRKEEQERRRREREERERIRRIQLQQEEERARIEALPNGLRRTAEIGPERAREPKEIKKWLPLRTATTYDLDPSCAREFAQEEWIANIQAAPLLANQDLELSQYTAWTRLTATPRQAEFLWRQLRRLMAVTASTSFQSAKEAIALENETKPKFFNLRIFWIKLSDFMDIVPRHPHLAGFTLGKQLMELNYVYQRQPSTLSTPSYFVRESGGQGGSPLMNGHLTNGES